MLCNLQTGLNIAPQLTPGTAFHPRATMHVLKVSSALRMNSHLALVIFPGGIVDFEIRVETPRSFSLFIFSVAAFHPTDSGSLMASLKVLGIVSTCSPSR